MSQPISQPLGVNGINSSSHRGGPEWFPFPGLFWPSGPLLDAGVRSPLLSIISLLPTHKPQGGRCVGSLCILLSQITPRWEKERMWPRAETCALGCLPASFREAPRGSTSSAAGNRVRAVTGAAQEFYSGETQRGFTPTAPSHPLPTHSVPWRQRWVGKQEQTQTASGSLLAFGPAAWGT